MKKVNNVTTVRVYRNELNEISVTKDLQAAQNVLQAVLNVWSGLELTPCNNICALIMNPETAYKKAINELAVVPVTAGRFQVSKEAYISTLDIPIPDSLYRAARAARQQPHAVNRELWNIEGDKVVMNETEAEELINSGNIYCTDEKQIKFARRLTDLVTLWNEVDRDLQGVLITPQIRGSLMGKFNITDKGIEINPDVLKTFIRDLK
jgi:hypothetical protein